MSEQVHSLDPETTMSLLLNNVVGAIGTYFPFAGKTQRLEATKVYAGTNELDVDNIEAQKNAKLRGRTWSIPIYADLALKNIATGEVVSSATKVTVAQLPHITRRYSYIVDGSEYQADHQWRLKAGAYSRVKGNGELETQFNLSKGKGFRVQFDPVKRTVQMQYGTSNISAYPVLKALGVSDDEIKKAWGDELFSAVSKENKKGQLMRLAKILDKKLVATDENSAADIVRTQMSLTKLDPETTEITLGKSFDSVTGDSVLLAANKLIKINRGEAAPDERDSILFKELWNIADHIPERIINSKNQLQMKLRNNIDRKTEVRGIVTPDLFSMPIKSFFTATSLSQQPDQTNPVDMIGAHLRTTLMGTGGIGSDNAVALEAKQTHPSQLGIIDPVHTPEGERSGISTHLALGVSKRGLSPTMRLWDTEKKEWTDKSPLELRNSMVAFADQYDMTSGTPKALTNNIVAVSPGGGDPRSISKDEIDYVIRSPKAMFSFAANLVPFLPSVQPNRAEMATRHIEQTVALKHREEPLVQSSSGSERSDISSWEKLLGKQHSHRSPVAGVVTAVTPGKMTIKDGKGASHVVQLYDNFPLNEKKTFTNSEATVKVGDKVDKGDLVADTNYTKNGVLALGTNLRVGYLAFRGGTFEDGIVVSETASKKLTSEHLSKERLFADTDAVFDLRKFRGNFPSKITDENAKKLDPSGVIRKGMVVSPGDTIVAAMRKADPSSEQIMLKGLHRALAKPYRDLSIVWDKPISGVVTDVAINGRETTVFVKTEEPADVADKLCYAADHEILTINGWKLVADIIVGDLVASLNRVTGYIEYVRVEATHTYGCVDENLYTLETTQVSMAVTKDHGLWAMPRKEQRYREIKAIDLYGKYYRLKMCGKWAGIDQAYFTFPSTVVYAGQHGNGVRTLPEVAWPMATYLMILGMYLSEGNCVWDDKNGNYSIQICQVKPANVAQLVRALEDSGIAYRRNGDKFVITGKQIMLHFHQFGLCYEKFIPEWVFALPPAKLDILYKWLMWGDGNETGTSHSYATTSRQLADGVQRLLLHIGLAGKIDVKPACDGVIKGVSYKFRECYRVAVYRDKLRPTINHGHHDTQNGQEECLRPYTGNVHCVTLAENHVLYTRRNGKAHWSCNSGRFGNKGVISMVLPDAEMPKDAEGNPIEIIMNPSGVPGRINPGQVLETSITNAAKAAGMVVEVNSFEKNPDKLLAFVPPAGKVQVDGHFRTVKTKDGEKRIWIKPYEYNREKGFYGAVDSALKQYGVSETTELFDSTTGKSLGQVLTGYQYVHKQKHQVASKLNVRAHGHGFGYDQNGQPRPSGRHDGAQRFGELGLYAMLAHGATANIREALSYKCFPYHEKVLTEHGMIEIGKIVTNRMDVRVASKNPDGTLDYKNITNYWRRPMHGVDILAVNTYASIDNISYRRTRITCADTHEFYTVRGKVHAKDLCQDDMLLTPGSRISQVQREVIIGSLLGDGSLIKKASTQFPSFQERHCLAQRDYLQFKADVLENLSYPRDVREYNAGEEGFNVGQQMVEWRTNCHPELLPLHETFYATGERRFPARVWEELTLLSLAIWFQDDGAGFIAKGNVDPTINIAACSMTPEELDNAAAAIERLTGVRFNVYYDDGYLVKQGVETHKFILAVAPYIHPVMQYKLCGLALEPGGAIARTLAGAIGEIQLVPVPVLGTKKLGKGEALSRWRGEYLFNLEVEDTHCYFVRNILVGNSDRQQDEVWTAIQTGQPLPAPRTSFAYSKFLAYLQAVGVSVEKNGNELKLVPLTDAQVLDMSSGELKDATKVVRGKDLTVEKDGLFDEKITGGPGGKKWSHITLAEPIPNPLYETAVMSILGLTGKRYEEILMGNEKLGEKTGPAAITAALEKVDVDKEIVLAKEDLRTARRDELNRLNRRTKYLIALKNLDMRPEDAYVTKHVGVIPPIFRPVTAMESGDLNVDGINLLYRDVAMMSQKLQQARGVLPEKEIAKLRKDLYDAVSAYTGIGGEEGQLQDGQDRPPGVLGIISGKIPKESFFHTKLMDRRQDLTARSVIVPDMSLGLDEIALPRKAAMTLYRPFIVKELVQMGFTPLTARAEIDKKSTLANRALEVAASKRPVLFKRDPVLHKFGIMAFKPKFKDGLSIGIHPLTCGGFNADFDGDQMALFVPITDESVKEAYNMMPSRNIFSPSTGHVMYQPTLEGQLGLYLISMFGKDSKNKYDTLEAAAKAGDDGTISYTDVVTAGGKRTTAGRAKIYLALPEGSRKDDLLTDPAKTMDKKNLGVLLTNIGKKETGTDFALSVDKLKNVGFGYAHSSGFSFSLADFDTLTSIRDKHLHAADAKASLVRANKRISIKEQDADVVSIYMDASKKIESEARDELKRRGSKLLTMNTAGVKPGWDQLKQLVIAPLLVQNASGRVIPVPIARSYSEGVSSADYYTASEGARKGLIEKVQAVREPGALTKQIINSLIPIVVTHSDCGTSSGISLESDEPEVVDRYLAKPVKIGSKVLMANTLITPAVAMEMRAGKVGRVVVRSPMKCELPKGLCAHCYGVSDDGNPLQIGTNIGVIAGQAIGERGTQLSMKTFHSGGVVGGGSSMLSALGSVIQLLKMPETLPGKATLSDVTGKVGKVEKSSLGGFNVSVDGSDHYIPGGRELAVKVGDDVRRGDALSSGPISPKDLLAVTDMDKVQRYMSDALYNAYKGEGVKRQNAEVVIRGLTNLGVVDDPGEVGDGIGMLRGDLVGVSFTNAANKASAAKTPMKVTPILKGVETLPLDQSNDWLARLQYRRLKDTLVRGANESWSSDIHGTHPVPGLAYSAEFGKKDPARPGIPY